MKRGEIYFIKSAYSEEGSEQRAGRPAVIVSNDKNNEHSEVVEVVFLTTKPKTDLPTHVFTRSALSPSTILCEQINSVSKARVDALIGYLTESEMKAVDNALMISLGINFEGGKQSTEKNKEADSTTLAEELKNAKISIPETDPSAELIKAQTERDIYRDLYRELLDHMKGVAD